MHNIKDPLMTKSVYWAVLKKTILFIVLTDKSNAIVEREYGETLRGDDAIKAKNFFERKQSSILIWGMNEESKQLDRLQPLINQPVILIQDS